MNEGDGAEWLDDIEIDDYAVRLWDPSTGRSVRIYLDGQVSWAGPNHGLSVLDNRIPQLVAEASQLGYDEATSRITRARRSLFEAMIGLGSGGSDQVAKLHREIESLRREIMEIREAMEGELIVTRKKDERE